MLKLKTLRDINGNNAKIDYIRDNLFDKEFDYCLRFLLDSFVLTRISDAKLNKTINSTIPTQSFTSIIDFLEYVKNGSGKDEQVYTIQQYIKEQNKDGQEILRGLVTKTYPINVGVSMYNKANKDNPIIESPYMGCVPFDENKVRKLIDNNECVISQVKNDGMFMNLIASNKRIDFTARSGLPLYINGRLVEEMSKIQNIVRDEFVLTGELMLKGYDRMTANGILRSLVRSNEKIMNGDIKEEKKFIKKYGKTISKFEDLIYVVAWDVIPLKDFKMARCSIPYKTRLSTLDRLISLTNQDIIKVTEYKMVKNYHEVMNHFQELLTRGEEGSVIKSSEGIWKDGKPNWQIKMKLEMTIDLKIVGFNSGKIGTKYEKTLGSLCMESEDGIVKTDMSGLTDEMRDEIWKNKEEYLNKVVEVKCNGISKNRDGGVSLLYPNFICLRNDKKEADDYKQINKIQDMVSYLVQ